MTKFVMPTVSFVEEYEPTSKLGRTAEDNPFNEIVAALSLSWDDSIKRSKGGAKAIITPDQTRTAVVAKFNRAANAAGYTARSDDKANETVNLGTEEEPNMVSCGVVCFYLVKQIHRARKGFSPVVVSHVDLVKA